MLEDQNDLNIVESVIGLAKAFKKEVIAEGVESIQHGVLLAQMGCQNLQSLLLHSTNWKINMDLKS